MFQTLLDFGLFQVEPLTQKRFYLQDLEEMMDVSNPIGFWFVSSRTIDSKEILSAGFGGPDKKNDLQQTKLALHFHFVV
jgi:hypothetical protein